MIPEVSEEVEHGFKVFSPGTLGKFGQLVDGVNSVTAGHTEVYQRTDAR
jgi:hypothetical protein